MSFLPLADHALVGLPALQAFAAQQQAALLGFMPSPTVTGDQRRAAGLP